MEIRLIGRPVILDDAGSARPVRGHQSWALLARILLADRPLDRRALSTELFPAAADPLGALRWCLAGLRRAIGSSDSFTGDPVEAALPAGIVVDVEELESGRFDIERSGDFLDRITPRSSFELDMWLMVQRQRIAGLIDAQTRAEALRCLSEGDTQCAVDLATIGVQRAALDERAHVVLVKSLVAAGSHAAASRHVEETIALFATELGTEPTSALRDAARPRFAGAPPGVSRRAVAASLLESGRAALDAGATDAGMECLRRAADEADHAGDEHLAATCLLELGTALVRSVRSYDDEGALLLQQSAKIAERLGAGEIGATAVRELGYIDALAGRRPAAQAHVDRARRLADGDKHLLDGVLAVEAFNLTDWGRHEQGLTTYANAVELSRETGNTRREAWALGLGGWAHLVAGETESARSWIDQSLRITSDMRWVAFRPFPLAVSAELELLAGTPPASLYSGLEESYVLSCSLEDPCWEGATARVIALAHAADGDHRCALEWSERSLRHCLRETDVYVGMHAAILATQADLALASGDDSGSQASARSLISLAARTHMDGYLARGLALLTNPTETMNRPGAGHGTAQ